ncbi:MAG: PaaI family thioesterase [Candidatus Rokubacteria bacterium]|nr:PaaI family thioesterase [Candidatus Rokubacteria bacterium]
MTSAFDELFAGLEEIRPASIAANPFHRCFGCGPGHPTGLRVRCFQTGDGVISPVLVPATYAGPPGAAHGGIVAAYLDEICAAAALRATGQMAVTGELTVRYVAPVPVERAVVGRGKLVADHGRYIDVEGRLEEFGTGRLLATAKGRFFAIRSGGPEMAPTPQRSTAPRGTRGAPRPNSPAGRSRPAASARPGSGSGARRAPGSRRRRP